jgi:hypothetical protein
VKTDRRLGESTAVLGAGREELARVKEPLGSPGNPMTEERLSQKVRDLAGDRLNGALDDPTRPAAEPAAAAGLL